MLETLYKNAINIYVFKIINQSLKQNIFGRQWISETITPSAIMISWRPKGHCEAIIWLLSG